MKEAVKTLQKWTDSWVIGKTEYMWDGGSDEDLDAIHASIRAVLAALESANERAERAEAALREYADPNGSSIAEFDWETRLVLQKQQEAKERQENAWKVIKSKQDLPQESGPIYLSTKAGTVETLWFYVDEPNYFLERGVAWMPNTKPSPYTEEANDE